MQVEDRLFQSGIPAASSLRHCDPLGVVQAAQGAFESKLDLRLHQTVKLSQHETASVYGCKFRA